LIVVFDLVDRMRPLLTGITTCHKILRKRWIVD